MITSATVRPECCPKFEGCSATVCPLDSDWRLRTHSKGERVCLWLREAAKPGGARILRGRLPDGLAEVVATQGPDILAKWGDIRRQVERGADTSSRIAAGQRLRRGVAA